MPHAALLPATRRAALSGTLVVAALPLGGCFLEDADGFLTPDETIVIGTLDDLQGVWVRTDGNNEDAAGMVVEVDGDAGDVLDPADTTLDAGDVKWRDITVAERGYTHDELGSDGRYYDASMTLYERDGEVELEIRVDAGGAGNFQVWERMPATASLDDLQGAWVRTDGNNEDAVGMIVEVDDDAGTVTDPASTSLSVDDVKWRDITVDGAGFTHDELGSDGSYYEATMTLLESGELEIQVAAAGAGNFQVWERPDE